MPKEIDRVIPIKRRISWIVPDNTEDIIKMASINSLSSLSYRQLDRLRDHIDYILQIVKSKKDQKDAILSIIYACDYYGADILKAPIEKLIRLTETLMGVNVEDYPDYETIINLLTERSVVKNENRRIWLSFTKRTYCSNSTRKKRWKQTSCNG